MDGEIESLADALLEALADDGRSDRLFGVYEESRPGVAGALRLRRILNEMRASEAVDPRWRRDLVRRLAEVAAVDPDAVSELRTFFPRSDPAETVPAQAPAGNAVIGGTALGPVSNSVSGGTFLGPVQGAGTQYNYFGPGLHPRCPPWRTGRGSGTPTRSRWAYGAPAGCRTSRPFRRMSGATATRLWPGCSWTRSRPAGWCW